MDSDSDDVFGAFTFLHHSNKNRMKKKYEKAQIKHEHRPTPYNQNHQGKTKKHMTEVFT